MIVEVKTDCRRSQARRCFSKTTLVLHGSETCEADLGLDVKQLVYSLGRPAPVELDLLFVSACAYGVDRLVPRSDTEDNWTRQFDVEIPVHELDRWQNVSSSLNTCLSFLTGDQWRISFRSRGTRMWWPMKRRPRSVRRVPVLHVSGVSLLSGGLDSLAGVIREAEFSDGAIVCVGHHDHGHDNSSQDRLLAHLGRGFPGRIHPLQVYCGVNGGSETSLRSRSFLFLGLGAYCATRTGKPEMVMPENGMIALNPPLSPARRGSCSTRTAHPHFIGLYNTLLSELGIRAHIVNPYEFMTKGEVVANCPRQDILSAAALDSVSCGKTGRFRTWSTRKRNVRGCGSCVPCLYRRASLHGIGLDTELYGDDVCSGEIDIDSKRKCTFDFRDMLTFLRSDADIGVIERELIAAGPLNVSRLSEYADLVIRGRAEVKHWLEDTADPALRRQWRLT